jgi:hypothetical protein
MSEEKKKSMSKRIMDFFFGSQGHLWGVLTEALLFLIPALIYAFSESELMVFRIDLRYSSNGEIFWLVILETIVVSLVTLLLLSLIRATIRGYQRDRLEGKFQ